MNILEKILEESFLDYSAFVLQRRAIPDARDGFKYTARQILHAQLREKLDAKHPFKKSQKSVAAATSFSYVHGDASCYEQIIRMGRPLVQRYFLEEFNGNEGTIINSSDYSAQRYTECRLSPLGMALFDYLKVLPKENWSPTYDEEGEFPLVLPSVGYYNICNGSFGSIGVGLISSIPQFNLGQINRVICDLISDPTIELCILPDFASGGILLNPKTTLDSLNRGEGRSALLRGVVKKNIKEKYLEVVELPYGVYTNTICVELQKALDKGKPPFKDFKDLTKTKVQIRIYTDKLDECEKWLYKNTSVQKHFTIKLIMLDNGKKPRLFTFKEALLAHIDHAKKVYRLQFENQLDALKSREEIIRGLIRAHSIIDDIIYVIKEESTSRADAIKNLISHFEFTELQATAIVDMKLHMLTKIDITKLEGELEQNLIDQDYINKILSDEEVFNTHLKERYMEVADKYGDKRRTQIYHGDEFESQQDGEVSDKEFMIFGGGQEYMTVTTEDPQTIAVDIMYSSLIIPGDEVVIITDQFRGFTRKSNQFVLGRGRWSDLIKLNEGEKVIAVYPRREIETSQFAILETDTGKIAVHQSYILTGASTRGKKLVSKKLLVQDVELSDSHEGLPQIR